MHLPVDNVLAAEHVSPIIIDEEDNKVVVALPAELNPYLTYL